MQLSDLEIIKDKSKVYLQTVRDIYENGNIVYIKGQVIYIKHNCVDIGEFFMTDDIEIIRYMFKLKMREEKLKRIIE